MNDESKGVEPEKIDLMPTWTGVLPILLLSYIHGETTEIRSTALAELKRMAKVADRALALERVMPK